MRKKKKRLTKFNRITGCYQLDIPENTADSYKTAMEYFGVLAERVGRMEDYFEREGIDIDSLERPDVTINN